jgi:hypothetical protein
MAGGEKLLRRGAELEPGGDYGGGKIRSQPASTPSTAIYGGRRGPDAGACIVDGGRRPVAVSNP